MSALNDVVSTAENVYENGVIVGTTAFAIDNMILAYRISLPGLGASTPANKEPGVALNGPANATLSAPADFTLTAAAYDQDGIITNVEFFEAGVKIGVVLIFSFQLSLTGVAIGSHSYTATLTDNSGAPATSAARVV